MNPMNGKQRKTSWMVGVVVRLVALMALVAFAADAAQATPIPNASPEVQVTVDGEQQSVLLEVNADGTGFSLPGGPMELEFQNGDTVTLNDVSGEFDPFVNTAIGVVDAGAPSVFFISAVTPITPISGIAKSTLALFGGITVPPPGPAGYSPSGGQTAFVAEATVEGTAVQGVGGAESFLFPGGNIATGGTVMTFVDADDFGGTIDSIDVSIGFTGTGGSVGISLTAIHNLEAIPEPSTFVLAGLGLIGVVLLHRRRR